MVRISLIANGYTVYFLYDKEGSWRAAASVNDVEYSNPNICTELHTKVDSNLLHDVTKYVDFTQYSITVRGSYIRVQFYRPRNRNDNERILGLVYLYDQIDNTGCIEGPGY